LLSVVVPCFNEERVISVRYARLIEVMGNGDFGLQIVFVDDGSGFVRPRFWPVVPAMAHELRPCFCRATSAIGPQPVLGWAMPTVMRWSSSMRTCRPPEVVLEMIRKWSDGADVVCGIRTKREESFLKRAGYSVLYRVFRRLSNIDARVDAGDFSLMDRKALDVINPLPERTASSAVSERGATSVKSVSPMTRIRAAGYTNYSLAEPITWQRRHS
jgi:dolichol-phosphate mannosyltransferase